MRSKNTTNPKRNRSPERVSWEHMVTRCNTHPNYRGRIQVCERWRTFSNFLADMGPRPSLKHSIDRFPDKSGNYEPSNCRWATSLQQNQNARTNRNVEFRGVTMCVAAWAKHLKVTPALIRWRLAHWPLAEALTRPPNPAKQNFLEQTRRR